jgi:hypothetical protein
MVDILEALVVKENGEDPLVAAVRQQVTISSESIFSMLMMHGVEFDAERSRAHTRRTRTGVTSLPRPTLSALETCLPR